MKTRRNLFLLPALVYPVPFVIFPLLFLLYMSLNSWSLPGSPQFDGLSNYAAVLASGDFQHSLTVTMAFTVLAVGLELLVGLAFALLWFGEGKLTKFVRTASFVPLIWAPTILAIDWRLIYDTQFGPVNYILRTIGLPTINIYATTGGGLYQWLGILIVEVWQWAPFVGLVLLSGLYSINPNTYEAAQIDGASRYQMFKAITLPLLKPSFIVALLFTGIYTLEIFNEIFVLTAGGPGVATESLSMLMYRYGFQFFNMGYGAAASVIFGILVAVVTGVIVLRFRRIILGGV